MNNSFILSLFALWALVACQPVLHSPVEQAECPTVFTDHTQHPKAVDYQEIMDRNRARGIAGVTVLIKDKDGIWTGSSGMADLTSQRSMQPCDRQMIASISKPFTATLIYLLIEEGYLSLDDQIAQYLPDEVVKKVANVDQATVWQLLSHRQWYTRLLFPAVFTGSNQPI